MEITILHEDNDLWTLVFNSGKHSSGVHLGEPCKVRRTKAWRMTAHTFDVDDHWLTDLAALLQRQQEVRRDK